MNWTLKFAASDPVHRTAWMELMSPKGIGLILRSIKTDYKFVSVPYLTLLPAIIFQALSLIAIIYSQ